MVLYELFAHLVNLQAGPFWRCRGVGLAGGAHGEAGDCPAAFGRIPVEHIPVHIVGQVNDFGRVDARCRGRLGLHGPHICIPHRQRGLEHLAQRLLSITLYHRAGCEFHIQGTCTRLRQYQAEGIGISFWQRHNQRCIREIAHVYAGIAAVYINV